MNEGMDFIPAKKSSLQAKALSLCMFARQKGQSALSKIDKNQIERMARLAKIELTDEQKAALMIEMESIIGFADQLASLDLGDTPVTTHAVEMKNVFREDLCKPSYDRTEILANAPEEDGECYLVPKVVG